MAKRDGHISRANFTNKDLAERIPGLTRARQPGTLRRYGYSTHVLGRVTEISSGQSLYQRRKERTLDPPGKTSTTFVINANEAARMAEPLPNDTVLLAPADERRKHSASKSSNRALLPTITDYARLPQMLLNDVLPDEPRPLHIARRQAMRQRGRHLRELLTAWSISDRRAGEYGRPHLAGIFRAAWFRRRPCALAQVRPDRTGETPSSPTAGLRSAN